MEAMKISSKVHQIQVIIRTWTWRSAKEMELVERTTEGKARQLLVTKDWIC